MTQSRKKTYLLIVFFLLLFAGSAAYAGDITVPLQIPVSGARSIEICRGEQCKGIGTYITLVYRFLVGFAAVLAVLALTWGGVRWLTSGGESGKIQEAQKTITNAIVGLLIAFLSYAGLIAINPALVEFKPLKIEPIKKIEFIIEGDGDTIRAAHGLPSGTTTPATSGPTPSSTTDFPAIRWLDFLKTRTTSREFGEVYADIYEHSPVTGEPWYRKGGPQEEAHPNRMLDGHEYTHYVDAANLFYVGKGKGFQLKLAKVTALDIKKNVPTACSKPTLPVCFGDYDFYFDYFKKYFDPHVAALLVLEELNARNAGMRVLIDMQKRGITSKNFYNPPSPNDPYGEHVGYTASASQWITFALTTALTLEQKDKDYFTREPQFKDALRYLIEDSRTLKKQMSSFLTNTSDNETLQALQTDASAKAIRDIARSWYGSGWTKQWLGFD